MSENYYKLLLVVAPSRSGKSRTLNEVADLKQFPRINVNLILGEQLLDLSKRQRATCIAGIFYDLIQSYKASTLILDNIELIFLEELSLDPLKLLQSVSRNKTIIAAWQGYFDGNVLTYAKTGHPEARSYYCPQIEIVTIS